MSGQAVQTGLQAVVQGNVRADDATAAMADRVMLLWLHWLEAALGAVSAPRLRHVAVAWKVMHDHDALEWLVRFDALSAETSDAQAITVARALTEEMSADCQCVAPYVCASMRRFVVLQKAGKLDQPPVLPSARLLQGEAAALAVQTGCRWLCRRMP